MIKTFQSNADAIQIAWQDGSSSTFHYIWLRDNAPENTHANGQKLVDTTTIPLDIVPKSVNLNGTLNVEWADQTSHFDPAWLLANAYDKPQQREQPIHWDATLAAQGLPSADYTDLASDDAQLADWLQAVHDYGFALISNVPTESEMLLKVVELFGYPRVTNYGSYFDVRAVADPINLAYTALTLSGHTDNPYRDPVPTLQLLHCLQNSAEGGESTLTDGWKVADVIRRTNPEAFELLTTIPVRFKFQSEDTVLSAEFPYIQLNAHGDINGIRFNNRSVMPFRCPPDKMTAFYRAHRLLATLLEDDQFKITFKLTPGDLFIVDNTRIMHGRIGYTGAGTRWLQGCYADKDSLLSKLAVLKQHR